MLLETVRVVADWLADATYGVNALAAVGPRDSGVTQPPTVTILDATRDSRVTRGGVPLDLAASELPALLVSLADQAIEQQSSAVAPVPPDASVTVLIRYVCRSLDTAKAERDLSQTLRAIWWSLGLLFKGTGESARSRASVQVISLTSLQAATLYESSNDANVTGGVLLTCRVRDIQSHA